MTDSEKSDSSAEDTHEKRKKRKLKNIKNKKLLEKHIKMILENKKIKENDINYNIN
jgi:hypothetical protein